MIIDNNKLDQLEYLPSANSNHVTIRGHKQFSSMAEADGLFTVSRGVDTHPRIFHFLWHQSENKLFSSTEIALATSVRILGFAIGPAIRTISTKNLYGEIDSFL